MRPGLIEANWKTLVRFHPQFVLAILKGVEARPSERVLAPPQFGSLAVGQEQTASFAVPISRYSIFLSAAYTIDPTGFAVGNLFQTTSDKMLNTPRSPTGITVKLNLRGGDAAEDYAPIIVPTPLQLAFDELNGAAGVWKLTPNQNPLATFIIASPPGGVVAPFSVTAVMTFLVLGEGGNPYLAMGRQDAICQLKQMCEWPSVNGDGPPMPAAQ